MKPVAAPAHPRRAAAWWLRWLLIMLLAFDQVSAPLHRHHHDNGVDAATPALGHGHHAGSLATHADGKESSPHLFHVVSAARAESRDSGWLPSVAADDALGSGAWLPGALFVPQPDVAACIQAARSCDGPPRPVPLSLPPDGRAPPARA